MTLNYVNLSKNSFVDENDFLIKKYDIDVASMPVIKDESIVLLLSQKILFIEKLLEAFELAQANKLLGNITNRGFGACVCDNCNNWSFGTNFNNTRNDISSMCAERSAILAAYNKAVCKKIKSKNFSDFEFKIKYICMAQDLPLNAIQESVIPCEDCLSWFNTNRYFDDDTLIFSFEKLEGELALKVTKLIEILPYRNLLCSNVLNLSKISYTDNAKISFDKLNLNENLINDLMILNSKLYKENQNSLISNQNIVCSIFANNKIYSSTKKDWTKRWFSDPLETVALKAIEDDVNSQIKIISFFGDECQSIYKDGLVSIKSIGRIRQKHAQNDALIILNLNDGLFVATIGDFLPKKFIQGYKII